VRTLATLCCVAAAMLCPTLHAQEAEPPPSKGTPTKGTPTKGTFDEKGGSGKMGLPTKRIYGERFHRNIKLPGPRPIRPSRILPPPDQSRHAPMRTPDYQIAPRRFFESSRADIDLIHRSKWNKDDPMPEPSRAPISILENPRPFDPRRVTGCGPACNPDRLVRQRTPDRTIAIRGIDHPLQPDADVIQTTARNPAAPKGMVPAAQTAAQPSFSDGPMFDPSLVGRDADRAVGQLRAYLAEYPDDFHAMRLLAVALLANKSAPEAAAVAARAYAGDPLLAGEPLDLTSLALDAPRTRALVTEAQSTAGRGRGNAWLLAVVLHQGAGDAGQARSALQRAAKAGLAHETVEAFEAALPGAAPQR
jgi:hypothetical protein